MPLTIKKFIIASCHMAAFMFSVYCKAALVNLRICVRTHLFNLTEKQQEPRCCRNVFNRATGKTTSNDVSYKHHYWLLYGTIVG